MDPQEEGGTMQWYDNQLPIVDIRHGANLTGHRDNATYHQDIPHWGPVSGLWAQLEGKP